ncbi:hypothetical protein BKA83DRAFT_4206682, partial [Pisolithus microcarpus]
MSAQDLSSDGEQSRFRTSIQFAKRWILRVCHLFHPFLRPCVSDYCHKSKHIHFLLPPMHTSSLVVPFIFLAAFPPRDEADKPVGVYRICSILFFNLSKSAVWLVAKSFLLLFLRGLTSSAQSTFFLVGTSCTLFHIPTCHCCSKPRILHPQL